jgi:5'-3' exonuclease
MISNELKQKWLNNRKERKAQGLTEIPQNERVLIFDMMYLFKSNYAVRPLITENGTMLGGVGGALRTIINTLHTFKAKTIICVFDGKDHTKKRKEIYSGYKANRGKNKNTLLSPFGLTFEEEQKDKEFQLKLLKHIVKLLPVKVIAVTGMEADDLIGYITHEYYQNKSGQRVIVSSDKDFVQLIDHNTVYYYLLKKKLYNLSNIHEIWDVPKDNIIYVRCIEGDSSDNIEGIKGLGLKTLIKIMPEIKEKPFPSLVSFISFIEENKERFTETNKKGEPKSKKAQSLFDGIDIIKRNYQLMQLTNIKPTIKGEIYINEVMNTNDFNIVNAQKINEVVTKYKLHDVINPTQINKLFNILTG